MNLAPLRFAIGIVEQWNIEMMGIKEFYQIRFDFFRFYDPLFHYSLRAVGLRLVKPPARKALRAGGQHSIIPWQRTVSKPKKYFYLNGL